MITRKYTSQATQARNNMLPGLKEHLRLLVDDFDFSLSSILSAAIEHAENVTGSIFLESEFSGTDIDRGGFYPIQKVISGDATFDGGRIKGKGEVTFLAGYPSMPPAARAAIYLIAASIWKDPEDGVRNLPTASTNLLKSYRRWQR